MTTTTHARLPLHDDHGHDDHGHDDHDDHAHHGLAPGQKPHESPFVVWFPLVLLAIPSVIIGYLAIGPMLFGDFFKGVIFFGENHPRWKNWHTSSTALWPWLPR
jgi:NADH-quinone oxidoreductase subunit L